jgi:hypothetical protein
LKRGFGGGSEIAALYLFIHACSDSSTGTSGLILFIPLAGVEKREESSDEEKLFGWY